MTKTNEGYVYLGFDDSGSGIKIGKSNNWERRMNEIRNMNPSFTVFMVFECDNMSLAEKDLHDRYANKRFSGEWFDLTSDDLADIVERFDGEKMGDEWKKMVKVMTGISE